MAFFSYYFGHFWFTKGLWALVRRLGWRRCFFKLSCFFSFIMLTFFSNLFNLNALLLLYSQEVQSISILHLHLPCVNNKIALGSRGHDFNKINQNDVLTHSLVMSWQSECECFVFLYGWPWGFILYPLPQSLFYFSEIKSLYLEPPFQ